MTFSNRLIREYAEKILEITEDVVAPDEDRVPKVGDIWVSGDLAEDGAMAWLTQEVSPGIFHAIWSDHDRALAGPSSDRGDTFLLHTDDLELARSTLFGDRV